MTTTGRDLLLTSLNLKIERGDTEASQIVQTFAASQFQSALTDGVDRNKAVRADVLAAIIGARGDKLIIEAVCSNAAGAAAAETAVTNCIFLEVIDITNVDAQLQYGLYGKISPFLTPKGRAATQADIDAVSKKGRSVLNNVAFNTSTYTTEVSQTTAGTTDTRIVAYRNNTTVGSITKNILKITPHSDGVILIKPASIVWADPDADAQGKNIGGVT